MTSPPRLRGLIYCCAEDIADLLQALTDVISDGDRRCCIGLWTEQPRLPNCWDICRSVALLDLTSSAQTGMSKASRSSWRPAIRAVDDSSAAMSGLSP